MGDDGKEETVQASHIDISILPDELMYAIFRQFDVFELMPYSRVCQRWRCLIDEPRLRKVLEFDYEYLENAKTKSGLIMSRILSNSRLLHTFRVFDCTYSAATRLQTSIDNIIPILAANCPYLSVMELEYCCDTSETSWQLIGTAPWPRLTHLSLRACKVNNRDLTMILPTLTTVTVLDLADNDDITDDGVLCIIGHTPNLRCLLLHGNHYLTCASTVPLLDAVSSHLTQLSISNPDRALLEALPTACIGLQVLDLDFGCLAIYALVGCLQKLTNLTHLHINDTRMTPKVFDCAPANRYDAGLGLRKLKYFNFNITSSMGDYLLEYITKRCGSCLRYLIIESKNITRGVLTDALSRCASIEYLDLYLSGSQPITLQLSEALSTLTRLRVFVSTTEPEDEGMIALIDHLKGLLPNALICDWWDSLCDSKCELPDIPDISFEVLQPDMLQ